MDYLCDHIIATQIFFSLFFLQCDLLLIAEKQVLDLSASGIKKLEKRDGVGIISLIVDNNELTKLENLECFPDLEKVSIFVLVCSFFS